MNRIIAMSPETWDKHVKLNNERRGNFISGREAVNITGAFTGAVVAGSTINAFLSLMSNGHMGDAENFIFKSIILLLSYRICHRIPSTRMMHAKNPEPGLKDLLFLRGPHPAA